MQTAFQRGLAAHRAGRPGEAAEAYRQALDGPSAHDAAYNLGVVLADQFRWDEAIEALELAERLKPGETANLLVRGVALARGGRPAEGESLLREVLRREPENWLAKVRMAWALFIQGRYEEAWPFWEARDTRRKSPLRALSFPEWRGEPLAGKSIVIWGEQGLGDEIQAARFIRALRDRGCARITVYCHPIMAGVFLQAGADEAHGRRGKLDVARHDYWAHMWSLPGRLGVTLETLAGAPYLRPPRAVERRGGVGVALRGNPANPVDRLRSMPDDRLARRIPGAVQLAPAGDALESLAQLAALDLIVTVDTSWAHMAGAIGKPCWLLIADPAADWRWFPARAERTPWYDSLRLFWQAAPGDWHGVTEAVLAALEGRKASP